MGRLEDLRVERVDGVDRPATGHRFVIVKSARNATQLLKELESAELTDEQRELVTELASTLKDEAGDGQADDSAGDDSDAADAPEGDETADDEDVEKVETDDADAPAAGIYDEQLLAALSTDEGKALLKGVIADVVDDELAELDNEGEPVSKSARLRSRQPRKQDGEQPRTVSKSKGEGMFSNIIFGQDRR